MTRAGILLLAALSATATGGAQTKPAPVSTPKATVRPMAAKPTASPKAGPSSGEQAIFDAANRERAAHKLPPLKWNARLASAARGHAQKMAQAGTLSHEFPGEAGMGMRIRMAGVHFSSVAENVAQGPSAAALHQLWMNSPPHRANILDPELDSLGVAIVERGGQLFAVQDFALAAP